LHLGLEMGLDFLSLNLKAEFNKGARVNAEFNKGARVNAEFNKGAPNETQRSDDGGTRERGNRLHPSIFEQN